MIKALKDLLFRYKVIIIEDYFIYDGYVNALLSLYRDDIQHMLAEAFNEHDKHPSFNIKIDEVDFGNYCHDNRLNIETYDEVDVLGNHTQYLRTLEAEDCISEDNILSYLRNKDDFTIIPI